MEQCWRKGKRKSHCFVASQRNNVMGNDVMGIQRRKKRINGIGKIQKNVFLLNQLNTNCMIKRTCFMLYIWFKCLTSYSYLA